MDPLEWNISMQISSADFYGGHDERPLSAENLHKVILQNSGKLCFHGKLPLPFTDFGGKHTSTTKAVVKSFFMNFWDSRKNNM